MTEILRNPEPGAWDDYAEENGDASFSHCFAWNESLAAVYRLQVFRLAARRHVNDQKLAGILPLILFAAPDRDLRLISLPYSDGAGVLADDAATGMELLTAALELADELGAVHVELRQAGTPPFHSPQSDFPSPWTHTVHSFKTGLRRPLPGSVDELWSLLPAKVRNQVRKARKCGCTVSISGPERVDDFYTVFSENMRDLGSPVHDPGLFRTVLTQPSMNARVVVVSCGTQPVATAIVFRHNATLFNPWASSLRRYRPSCPNMLLYWAMLELAITCDCRWFDFGRSSPDAATCRFKRQWGATMQPLTWHVFSRKPHHWEPRRENLVDENSKLLDLPTSRQNGPTRRRWISL